MAIMAREKKEKKSNCPLLVFKVLFCHHWDHAMPIYYNIMLLGILSQLKYWIKKILTWWSTSWESTQSQLRTYWEKTKAESSEILPRYIWEASVEAIDSDENQAADFFIFNEEKAYLKKKE